MLCGGFCGGNGFGGGPGGDCGRLGYGDISCCGSGWSPC